MRSSGAPKAPKPSTNFDQNSPEFAADPWSKYAELRSGCPVAHTDAHGGFWVLSKYDDVVKVAKDDATFSSVPTTVIPDSGVYNLIPLQSDPPDVQRYRMALMPYFSANSLKKYEPRVRQFTSSCIDAFIQRGDCELVTELANPVPSMTALEFIGFNPVDWHDFAGPLHQLSFSADGSEGRRQALLDIGKMDERITAAIADRRAAPRDDAISDLVAYEKNGVRFSDKELHGLVKMLLFGGLDTTMAAASNVLLYLSEHPELRQRLIDDPGLIPKAVDEFLRFEAPVHAFSRNVMKDTEIGGQTIRAGERVYMLWASANRDPDQFENPDEVDFERKPNRHLTFGIGAHRCLGAQLARMELRIMLEEVLRRIPDFKVDLKSVRQPTSVTIIWGRTSLPATFTPAALA
jgi:cytochrome P450